MEEEARGKNKVLIIVIVVVVLLLIGGLSFILFANKEEPQEYKHIDLYKYEVYNGEYKYYVNKLEANKIGLVDKLEYKCHDQETCEFVNSVFANGNINDEYVVIRDGRNILLYKYKDNKTINIAKDLDIETVNFVDDNYLLLSKGNKFYSYNIKTKRTTDGFTSDLLINDDGEIPTVFGNNIVTIDNDKFGLVNLDTGNNTYDNVYSNISCHLSSCIFSIDDNNTIYSYEDGTVKEKINHIGRIVYFDNTYLAYINGNDLVLYNFDSDEKKVIKKYDFKNIILSISNDIITVNNDSKCYTINYNGDNEVKEEINCPYINKETRVFTTTKNKANLTVVLEGENKTTYDLKVNTDGTMYDNVGTIYDSLTFKTNVDKVVLKEGVVINASNAYSFLNKVSTSLELNNLERLYFINKWLPILVNNGYSVVKIEVTEDAKLNKEVSVLSNLDSYTSINMIVQKVDGGYEYTKIDYKLKPINRNGLSVVLISGTSY